MSTDINTSGNYTAKETGERQTYDFTYQSYDSIDDCLEALGEVKVLALFQRMVKVDANNNAREKAKVANGHSTRVAMSEEEKAQKKAERSADRALLERLKANPELLSQVQG